MTIREFAIATGRKVRTVRGWIHEGKIRANKVGNKWDIPEEELCKLELKTFRGN